MLERSPDPFFVLGEHEDGFSGHDFFLVDHLFFTRNEPNNT